LIENSKNTIKRHKYTGNAPQRIGQHRKTPQKAAEDLEIAKIFQISLENHLAPLQKAQRQPTTVKNAQ
jgi:hypothetical protein